MEEIRMSRLQSVLCGIALALGGCAVSTGDAAEDHVSTASDVQEVRMAPGFTGPFSTAANVTCTDTFGVCKVVSVCEGIRNDTRQIITETCCTAAGSCTTELYGLCGC
jgi:hypothetical protein